MKKFLLLFFATFLVCGTANAVPIYWDLEGTGFSATGGTVVGSIVNYPLDMTTSGYSQITQSLTGGTDDTILDEGDTFSEFGAVTVLSANTSSTEKAILFDGGNSTAYVVFSGLTGSIYNYNDGGTPTSDASGITDDTFQFTFDPGVGSIDFYLETDDDLDPTTNATHLASLTLLEGEGYSPFDVGGTFPEGDISLSAGFTWVKDDFWFLEQGLTDIDFNDFMDTYGIPSIFATSFNLGATLQSDPQDVNGDILISVTNEGSFIFSAVPEPTTMVLFGIGLLGFASISRRRSL